MTVIEIFRLVATEFKDLDDDKVMAWSEQIGRASCRERV